MRPLPFYFEAIRANAVRRWGQLEEDPELAGPWHLLFEQVQSPRHVLSELLQNADDAGATEAAVRIEDGVFIFEHNGEDFTSENFASLCRFGYSNKRSLHTIGFRGIGFKSTFSLGDQVELFTPTLAVGFHRSLFTEPRWLVEQPETCGLTRIRVIIADQHRQDELAKNLSEWRLSPHSLLFFKHLRQLQVNERTMCWSSVGPGPVTDSMWMSLDGHEDKPLLLLRSPMEAFPEEALAEIRQERRLPAEHETNFPSCSIELVVGAPGRLFVVLPTGVETGLPFACNAPFIQDPARLKIKDPETSPTNRWLLKRAGRLAASTMRAWLDSNSLLAEDRASAYALLPGCHQESATLEGACGTIVRQAFDQTIADKPILLTEGGELVPKQASIIIPRPLLDVWSAEQVATLFDNEGRPPLCRHIDQAAQSKLLSSGMVGQITTESVLATLKVNSLPKPQSWRQLLNLWAYLAPLVATYQSTWAATALRIVPVQGQDVLRAASEIVRLSEKRLLQSDADWEFLAQYLVVLNPNWTRFLGELSQTTTKETDSTTHEAVNAAFALLAKLQHTEASEANKVMERVVSAFFAQKTVTRADCIRLSQIAAKLNIKVNAPFQYVTRDNYRRHLSQHLLFDESGELEELIPEYLHDSQMLHPDYTTTYTSCSRAEWQQWVLSGRSGLHTFIPLISKRKESRGLQPIEKELRRRGVKGKLSYPYKTNKFIVEDWDFDEQYWRHWEALVAEDSHVWLHVAEALLHQRSEYWQRAKDARFAQVATTGSVRSLPNSPVIASWIARLQEKPCLRDTRGVPRQPNELLRRTAVTEALLDVEPFIESRYDTESARPLLDLLGVRSTPTGPERLLERLRALAKAPTPPIPEVEKWYYRLDQTLGICSTAEAQMIKVAFQTEKLLLTQEGVWEKASAVSLAVEEEDVPGLAVVRASLHHLALWRHVGVAERASVEQALGWLKTLSSASVLTASDVQRVRKLQTRYPDRVWNECRHWLNLEGGWASIESFRYALTMQSLTQWAHLHAWVKQKTADFRRLPSSVTLLPPFSVLPQLAQHIEDRLDGAEQNGGSAELKVWLSVFGQELQRVTFDDEEDTAIVRALAEQLTRTMWRSTETLEVVPYINGVPAGTARRADVQWVNETLYVTPLPKAKLARFVPEVIGAAFGRPEIKAALDYSFERSPEDIREYLAANFTLDPLLEAAEIGEPEATGSDTLAAEDHTREQKAADEGGSAPPVDIPTDEASIISPTGSAQVAENPPTSNDEPNLAHTNPDSALRPTPTYQLPVQPPRPRPAPAPQPALIERFAQSQGFRKATDGRYVHADGSWIGRTSGDAFPWQRLDKGGQFMRYYLPVEHCIEHEPLVIAADRWGLLEHKPDIYALIVLNPVGEPLELTGARLCALRDGGSLTLYPATYRLVYTDDHD